MATLFTIVVTIIILGWLWFYVARPILEDFGIISGDTEPETVKPSQGITSSNQEADPRTARTDGADGPSVSVVNQLLGRLEVDRTKTAIIELLVYSDWTTAEIRAVVKGENAAIGTEVEAARKRLGIDPPERTLKVRDMQGERVIPY